MRRAWKITALVLACCMLVLAVPEKIMVSAGSTSENIAQKKDEISQAKEERKKLQQGLNDIKNMVKELEKSKSSLKNYVKELDTQLMSVQAKIEELKELITEKEAEIENYMAETRNYDVVLHVKPEKANKIHASIIDGKKCIVIPMEENEQATINGVNTAL